LYAREKRPGFFARGSHAHENDKPGEYAAFCHSRAWLPREESRVFAFCCAKIDASIWEKRKTGNCRVARLLRMKAAPVLN
jgi:hypothetical protein